VASPEHALARQRGPIDAAGLADVVQIVLGEHRHDAQRGSDDHGVLSPRRWRVVDLATKHALIASGLGWGHMPEHVVRDDLRAGRLVALELEAWGLAALRRSLVLVRRPDVVMGPIARWAQGRLGELCRRQVEPDAALGQPGSPAGPPGAAANHPK
jgi:DNA-binding transcriptional LysR family regulator